MPALTDEGVRGALVQAADSVPEVRRKGSYMSTMAELRGGLTEGQKAHAANLRLQLQRDLEQQVVMEISGMYGEFVFFILLLTSIFCHFANKLSLP